MAKAKKPSLVGGKYGSMKNAAKQTKGSGGAQWIKFISKEEDLVVRFLTEPEEWVGYEEVFDEEARMYRPLVEGEDGDALGGKYGPSKRTLTNALDVEEDRVVALKLPISLANKLVERANKRGTITDRDFELSVTSGKRTEYNYEPLDKEFVELSDYELLDLEQVLIDTYMRAMDENDDDIDDDDDDDDDEPRGRRNRGRDRGRGSRSSNRRSRDDDDDDDDEDEDDEPVRRKPKSKTKRKPVEEDDEDDDIDLHDIDDEEEIEIDIEDLDAHSINELREIAEALGIEIKSRSKKPFIEAIREHYDMD